MNVEWYYGENGKIVGPISLEEVSKWISQAQSGPHLVWTDGMAQWADAKTIAAFEKCYRVVPPPLPLHVQEVEKDAPDQLDAPSIHTLRAEPRETPQSSIVANNVHPWRRYFARMFDIYTFGLMAGVALGILSPSVFNGSSQSSSTEDQFLGLLMIAAYVPFEAFSLYAFGTTVGKVLYGIKLFPSTGQVAFPQALRRSASVWVSGLGIGIPLISLFTMISAYRKLKATGTTTWDAQIQWSVTHSEFGVARWVGIFLCWAGLTFVLATLIELGSR